VFRIAADHHPVAHERVVRVAREARPVEVRPEAHPVERGVVVAEVAAAPAIARPRRSSASQ
jgi:hypothetical protein